MLASPTHRDFLVSCLALLAAESAALLRLAAGFRPCVESLWACHLFAFKNGIVFVFFLQSVSFLKKTHLPEAFIQIYEL